jgi:hypothetical protein
MKKRRVLLHQPLQSAFAESRARRPIVNEIQKIAALVTDGFIGYSIQIDSVHDTLEQARAVCPEDEEDFYIASKPAAREEAPAPTSAPDDDEAIPF